jgi:hypothetical protein
MARRLATKLIPDAIVISTVIPTITLTALA